MSVSRHLKEPFFATALSRMDDSVAGIVRGLDRLVKRSPVLSKLMWPGSGWRPNSVEHNSGCAIDYIVVAVGHRPTPSERAAAMRFINEVLIPNWKALGIRWILYSTDGRNRTQSWNPARGYWKNLDPRGGVSADHVDHIHILFNASATWPKFLDNLVIGGTPVTKEPAPKAKPAPKPAPVPKPSASSSTRTLQRGSVGDDVKRLQEALLRVFPAYARRIRNNGGPSRNFGPATEATVREFQRRSSLKVDGIVGPATRAALARHGVKF